MKLNVEQENESLHALTVRELRQRYLEVFGDQTRTGNRTWLIRRILWRLQAITEGDLSERARQRAAELANDADLRLSAPREPSKQTVPVTARYYTPPDARADTRLPLPGTVLTRDYKGRLLRVLVLDNGFEFEGARFR